MSGSILDSITNVEAIDCTYLTGLMRKAGYGDAAVVDFTREPAGGLSHGGGSVYRFRLTYSGCGSNGAPGSVILKESREIKSQALDPAFARREIDCYQNGIFKDINEKLYIPKAYYLSAQPDMGQYWVWMEDLGKEAFNIKWSPEVLVKMIRDITELHAKWWGRIGEFKKLPFLRHRAQAMYDGVWADRIAQNCNAVEAHLQADRISRVFTPERRKILMQLSKAAELVYPRLEALPQTLLHHDIWLPNLGICNGKTVLIDWSYAGPGTPGADLSQTAALLFQMWGPDLDDEALVQALWSGLREDWQLPVRYEDIVAGYELTFCLRPTHALGGPILGSILSGSTPMVGKPDLESRLASAEATLQRIERGVRRLENC